MIFADHTDMFMLRDGTVNDGYFEPNGCHITPAATTKLLRNMGVALTDVPVSERNPPSTDTKSRHNPVTKTRNGSDRSKHKKVDSRHLRATIGIYGVSFAGNQDTSKRHATTGAKFNVTPAELHR